MHASRWHSLFNSLVLLTLFAAPASAQTLRDWVPSIDVVRARLNLTADQEAKLRPLFQKRAGEIQATRATLEQASSEAGKRAVLRDAKSQAQSFNSEVESVLNKEQKAEWREMRDETREKVKERYEQEQESESR
jgi:Skp family chaperone for outer membrane proteins